MICLAHVSIYHLLSAIFDNDYYTWPMIVTTLMGFSQARRASFRGFGTYSLLQYALRRQQSAAPPLITLHIF